MYGAWLLLASGEDHGAGGFLTPETGLVFWMVLSFALLAMTLKKAAWGPLLKGLDDREGRIRESLAAAAHATDEAARLIREHEAQLETHRREGEKIIEEARADAKGLLERARVEAEKEAEAIKARSLREISMARDKILEDLRQGSVDLAVSLAGRVISAELDRNRHRGLIDEFLKTWHRN